MHRSVTFCTFCNNHADYSGELSSSSHPGITHVDHSGCYSPPFCTAEVSVLHGMPNTLLNPGSPPMIKSGMSKTSLSDISGIFFTFCHFRDILHFLEKQGETGFKPPLDVTDVTTFLLFFSEMLIIPG